MSRDDNILKKTRYEIYSVDEVVRLDYNDGLPRIKKIYKNSKGFYIKGQPYWEPSALYLEDFEERLRQYCKENNISQGALEFLTKNLYENFKL